MDPTSFFGREVQRLSRHARSKLVRRAFEYWRRRDFPYLRLSDGEIESEYRRLCEMPHTRVLVRGQAQPHTVGLRLANSFHPQMWSIRRNGRSALELFHDDESLLHVLSKSAQFYPDRRCWSAPYVRGMFRFYHGARAGNFRPAVARAIYERFSRQGDTVLDFAAGFGGRMLGALTLERHYIGIDPSTCQMRGLRSMQHRLRPLFRGTAVLHKACAEDFLTQLPARSVDMILSSPPYFNNERYSREATQSFNRYPTYEIWRCQFLFKLIAESHRILKPGGLLLLNVANLPQATLVDDARYMARALFRERQALNLLMRCLPNSDSKASGFRTEPILVLEKILARRAGVSKRLSEFGIQSGNRSHRGST